MSIPTHLQLELAAGRPSPLYIASMADPRDPYESAAVKFERLLNVLRLPFSLELAMGFGALACADAWLYTFTILPLRFVNAFAILAGWWLGVVAREARWVVGFVWYGVGRVRERWRSRTGEGAGVGVGGRNRSSSEAVSETSTDGGGGGVRTTMNGHGPSRAGSQQRAPLASKTAASGATGSSGGFRHRRTKSEPSKLSSFHKADLLQGGVLLFSCLALMRLDASRMYHVIRAQSAIKLYVIYNALEVGDRLLSALGQDVIECLLCSETLSRNASGRSKVLLPLGMFALALVYNIAHSVALFYQVITLNVAVNSYSNALLTLLMSNQFVEIKSTVFKRFEKENLFQLTCADIVERFQLCLMVFIIAMRNVVEVGYLFVPGSGIDMLGGAGAADDTTVSAFSSSGYANATASAVSGTSWWSGALHTAASLPHSFTALPSWLWSIDVLSPFVIVLGSEVIVDWIKHAYVTKFNNVRPTFYARIMDILCKDYYTNVSCGVTIDTIEPCN